MATLALSLLAPPAGAIVARIGGHVYGVTPIAGVNPLSIPGAYRASGGPRRFDEASPLTYHGGPVMHSVSTHVVFWDPEGEFMPTTKGIVSKFFTDVAHDSGLATNVFAIAGQYKDGSGRSAYISTFAG